MSTEPRLLQKALDMINVAKGQPDYAQFTHLIERAGVANLPETAQGRVIRALYKDIEAQTRSQRALRNIEWARNLKAADDAKRREALFKLSKIAAMQNAQAFIYDAVDSDVWNNISEDVHTNPEFSALKALNPATRPQLENDPSRPMVAPQPLMEAMIRQHLGVMNPQDAANIAVYKAKYAAQRNMVQLTQDYFKSFGAGAFADFIMRHRPRNADVHANIYDAMVADTLKQLPEKQKNLLANQMLRHPQLKLEMFDEMLMQKIMNAKEMLSNTSHKAESLDPETETSLSEFIECLRNKKEVLKWFLTEGSNKHDDVKAIHLLARMGSEKNWKTILSVFGRTPDVIVDLLSHKDSRGRNVMHYLANENQDQIADMIIRFVKKYGSEQTNQRFDALMNQEDAQRITPKVALSTNYAVGMM